MAVCAQCGEDNPERARFCLACGRSLTNRGSSLEMRKTVTVLFCDVAGSTRLGEERDPEQLRRLMSRYYERARTVLERHGGTVEKFIGDAVVGVFGIPVLHEDDALRSLRAAVELREAIDELNVELEAVFGKGIEVRIGVNSGGVVAGDTGAGEGYASGDAVNVAQRLEAGAGPGEILIGDTTRRLARDAIRTEPAGELVLEGRNQPVVAHRLLEVLPGLPSHARRFDSPMVGRGRELRLLEDAFERVVTEESCHLFTVLGSAGVGKSRLIREALAGMGVRARILVGHCLPYGEGITFWAVLEVVKQATGIVDEDSPAEALTKIEALLAGDDVQELAARRVAALVGLTETDAAAEEGFWGFRKLLEASTREQPLVVVFDDVNWGEATFLDLVDYLTDSIRDAPVLLACIARPDLLDVRPLWGGGKRNATSIFLEPLSESESGELLGNLLGAGIAGDVLTRIHGAAEGNPLFVEEMVSMLIEGDFLRQDGSGAFAAELDRIPVPESIQVLLASRLDQLSPGERRAIERGAIEGAVFHRGAVEALADEELRGYVDECLAALVRKELIRPYRASFAAEDAFRFRHVLIRDAAYDAVPKQVRGELHERFAVWLEDVAGDRVAELEELIGYHLEQAYRYRIELTRLDERAAAIATRAVSRLSSAGRRAVHRGDFPAGASLLSRAAELIGEDAGARSAVLGDLGDVYTDLGRFKEAEDALQESLAAAERIDADGLQAHAIVRLARLRGHSVGARAGLVGVEDALETFDRLQDDAGAARALQLLASQHWAHGQVRKEEKMLRLALERAERLGQTRQLASLLNSLAAVLLAGPTPAEEGLEECAELLRRAPADRMLQAAVAAITGVFEAMRGRFERARSLARASREAFETLGMTTAVAGASYYYGRAELLAGDASAAEAELEGCVAALRRLGEKQGIVEAAAQLAEALRLQGRFEAAAEFSRISEEAITEGDVLALLESSVVKARLLVDQGSATEGERLARHMLELADRTDAISIRGDLRLALAAALQAQGRSEEALLEARTGAEHYDAKGIVPSAQAARALITELAAAVPS